jgi:hypothetical protein
LVKVTVGQGDAAKTYSISEALLNSTSKYFTKAPQYHEELVFPDDDLQTWKVLLSWMFTHQLPPLDELGYPFIEGDYDLAIKCWMLGDKYLVYNFKHEVMSELRSFFERCSSIPLDTVKVAFDGSPPGSSLRRVMIRELCDQLDAGTIEYKDLSQFDGVAYQTMHRPLFTLALSTLYIVRKHVGDCRVLD